jgi:hypothetical protein
MIIYLTLIVVFAIFHFGILLPYVVVKNEGKRQAKIVMPIVYAGALLPIVWPLYFFIAITLPLYFYSKKSFEKEEAKIR